jgi:hypothetical protein
MSSVLLLAIALSGAAALLLINYFHKKLPRRLDQGYFHAQWAELLERVKTPDGMILAVIDADKLLDEALKRRRFRGKTMGERLVAAQRTLSDNDAVWYAHKLRNRLVHEPSVRLKKREAQTALTGFRQGLKDLGAI